MLLLASNQTLADELVASAEFVSKPDVRFLERMTPTSLRRTTYQVRASIKEMALLLTVQAGGMMTAEISAPAITMEGGNILPHTEMMPLVMAETGEQALIPTAFTNQGTQHMLHLNGPGEVVRAFLNSFGTYRFVGGFNAKQWAHWSNMVQLVVDRIAQETGKKIEVKAILPQYQRSVASTNRARIRKSRPAGVYQVYDVTDPENYATLTNWDKDFDVLDDRYQPTAGLSIFAAPCYLIRQTHTELFHSRNL